MVAKITQSQRENRFSWIRGVKSEGGMSTDPSDWGRTHWRPCKRRKQEGPPVRAGACRIQGAFGISHSLVSFFSRLRFREKNFLLIQVWSGHLLDISGRWGGEEMPPQENEKVSEKWVGAKPAPTFFPMLCLWTVSRTRSPSAKAQLLTFEVKSSWNQRVRPRQHLGVTIWTQHAERGTLTAHCFLFQLVIEVKIKQT